MRVCHWQVFVLHELFNLRRGKSNKASGKPQAPTEASSNYDADRTVKTHLPQQSERHKEAHIFDDSEQYLLAVT